MVDMKALVLEGFYCILTDVFKKQNLDLLVIEWVEDPWLENRRRERVTAQWADEFMDA